MTASNVFAAFLLKAFYFCKTSSTTPQDHLCKADSLTVNFMAKLQPVQSENNLQLD